MATRPEDLIRRHRYTVDEYRRMGEAGILGEDDRVELIEGEIVDMAPRGSRHAGTVKQMAALFARAVGADRGSDPRRSPRRERRVDGPL